VENDEKKRRPREIIFQSKKLLSDGIAIRLKNKQLQQQKQQKQHIP